MTINGSVPGVPGAIIRVVSELPDELPGATVAGTFVQAVEHQLLIIVPGVARYLVQNGRTVDVAPEPGADPATIRIYLEGCARGAIIHQRGELPLHAATLVHPDSGKGVAICGVSGAGKSTIGAELSRRGWRLIADDITRLTWEEDGPLAWPSHGALKLWGDACARLDVDVSTLFRVRDGMEKFYLPVPSVDEPVGLSAVVELAIGRSVGEERVDGFDKLETIIRHTYRPRQVRPLGRLDTHMRIVAQVAGRVDIVRVGGARAASPRVLAHSIEALTR
jgi:hypothetical protein